ncbi:MAG: tRNA 2-thiouridine(34) synthase MnmA [Leptospirales bacterium]|nr:tRNA 2-thiouridine(34) synthase MnmA [Leptospirales bacterium]
MKIAVGMSGGVDSSVAAFLLKNEGYDVCGVSMRVWPEKNDLSSAPDSDCRAGDDKGIKKAGEVCRTLGIEHHVFDLSHEYENTVLAYFKDEYRNGRTPNPCVVCNQIIKFGMLPLRALERLGAPAFATGHYAKLVSGPKDRIMLMKGKDENKEQSYFLYRLNQKQLGAAIFPLGEMTKDDVKNIAREKGIPSWDEPDSQDFCMGDYRDILNCDDESGEIVTIDGKVLGFHKGIWNYTVGQRRGLGISSDKPLYVKAIEPSGNRVIVASKQETMRDSFTAGSFNWVSAESFDDANALTVKVRYSQKSLPCEAEALGGKVRINLLEPQGEIARGQSAVIYDGDILIGGGIIEYE